MTGRVTESPSRRANHRRNVLGPHYGGEWCEDVRHAKYVSNARALLILGGPELAPDILLCGCRFLPVWVSYE